MGFLSKKNFNQLLGIVLSGLLLYAAFTNVKVSVLIDGIGDTRLIYVFLGVGAFIISYLIRALLWKTLLRSCNDITVYPLFKSVVIGQMGNSLIPFRGGELLRAYSIKKSRGISISIALTSILVERVFDLVSLIIMIGVLSFYMEIPEFLGLTIGGIIILVKLFYIFSI